MWRGFKQCVCGSILPLKEPLVKFRSSIEETWGEVGVTAVWMNILRDSCQNPRTDMASDQAGYVSLGSVVQKKASFFKKNLWT